MFEATVYTLISTAVLYSSLPYSTLFNSILLHFTVCDRTIGDYPLLLRCQLFQFWDIMEQLLHAEANFHFAKKCKIFIYMNDSIDVCHHQYHNKSCKALICIHTYKYMITGK